MEPDLLSAMSRRQALKTTVRCATLTSTAFPVEALASAHPTHEVIVTTVEGRLRGLVRNHIQVFKGIRYGESTGGTRRFQPPIPVRPWTGIREARRLGAPSPQINHDMPPWLDPEPASEDCLFLNVWAPEGAKDLPVMVWAHGGNYYFGSGGAPGYDGENLAKRGKVVVVTVNHRLNIFGYLHLAELSSEFAQSANLGQQDLVEALRWVQRNIATFGGDPANVTIFGQSGGGGKVNTLLNMPSAKGLFGKAIIQSGLLTKTRSKEQATVEAEAVLAMLGIAPHRLRDITAVPTKRLTAVFSELKAKRAHIYTEGSFSPCVDGQVLPFQPSSEESAKFWKDIPVLLGSTEAEFALFFSEPLPNPESDAEMAALIYERDSDFDSSRLPGLIDAYRQQFPNASRQELMLTVGTGILIWRESVRLAESRLRSGYAPVFAYLDGWRDPCLGGFWAIHGVELPFIFDKLDYDGLWDGASTSRLRAASDPDGRRFWLRDTLIEAWTNFARHGVPKSNGLPEWTPYDLARRYTMHVDQSAKLVSDPYDPKVREALRG